MCLRTAAKTIIGFNLSYVILGDLPNVLKFTEVHRKAGVFLHKALFNPPRLRGQATCAALKGLRSFEQRRRSRVEELQLSGSSGETARSDMAPRCQRGETHTTRSGCILCEVSEWRRIPRSSERSSRRSHVSCKSRACLFFLVASPFDRLSV